MRVCFCLSVLCFAASGAWAADLREPVRYVTDDIRILDHASALLADENRWNRKDTRECLPQAQTISLFCALQAASIEVLGRYDHRRAALEAVRAAVEEFSQGRQFQHRLMDFNNLPTTTFGDVKRVLALARARIVANVELREKLEAMGTADQAIRDKMTPFVRSGDMKSDAFKALVQETAAVDARNLAGLEELIAAHGWPGIDAVGVDASNSAFLIVQHSPLAAKKRMLPTFREAVAEGKARGDQLAMLEDRIRIGDGEKQLYGSQITAGPDGIPRVDPIEDPRNLDARRKTMGMTPIGEYLDRMEKEIGRAIDRSALNPGPSP